ncbi:hypothetical protein KKB99_03245 [bacterium]|nr:hypothetical protein [bacterium]MBU1025006.1 hypothetical protein [bacterium]
MSLEKNPDKNRSLKKFFIGIILVCSAVSVINASLSSQIIREAGTSFGDYNQYSGIVHVHTTYSDGGGTFEEVGQTADEIGMHFLITCDHNTIQPYLDPVPKYVGRTLIVPGVEISTDNNMGHFLVIGNDIPIVPASGISSDEVFNDAVEKGMMTFPAHPFHSREKLDWENWDIGEFTGMELFNLDECWRESLTVLRINRLLSATALCWFSGYTVNHISTFPEADMKKFDELCKERRIVGIGSTDAHSKIKLGYRCSFRFPDYKSMFNFVQTVIVTREPFNGDYEHDRGILFNALRNGNVYVGFGGLENPRGFGFTAKSDTDETAIMGEELNFNKSAKLNITIPDSEDVTVQIIKDGEIFTEFSSEKYFEISIKDAGVYRVQVFQHRKMLPFLKKRSYTWILSNPIYVNSNQK